MAIASISLSASPAGNFKGILEGRRSQLPPLTQMNRVPDFPWVTGWDEVPFSGAGRHFMRNGRCRTPLGC